MATTNHERVDKTLLLLKEELPTFERLHDEWIVCCGIGDLDVAVYPDAHLRRRDLLRLQRAKMFRNRAEPSASVFGIIDSYSKRNRSERSLTPLTVSRKRVSS
jgi:hypothetical protein